MQLIATHTYTSQAVEEFLEQLKELNLIRYASEAAVEMKFGDAEEFHEAIKRSMEICIHAGIPVEGNFKRIYMCSDSGISYDWKLSLLAYQLVCMNGSTANENVAHLQIGLLKNQSLNA